MLYVSDSENVIESSSVSVEEIAYVTVLVKLGESEIVSLKEIESVSVLDIVEVFLVGVLKADSVFSIVRGLFVNVRSREGVFDFDPDNVLG